MANRRGIALKGPLPADYLNFIRNPLDPFVAQSTLEVSNVDSFTNSGAGTWTPMDVPTTQLSLSRVNAHRRLRCSGDQMKNVSGTGYQSLVTEVDPTTGLTRLIAGNLEGVYSGLITSSGTFETSIGNSTATPGINRNGDLDLAQLYNGAVEPSSAAAQVAGALFYAGGENIGGQESSRNLCPQAISRGARFRTVVRTRSRLVPRLTSRAMARSYQYWAPFGAAKTLVLSWSTTSARRSA